MAHPEPATTPPAEAPFRWGRAILVVLGFILVALGRHFQVELGEWMESIFGG